MDSIKKQTVIKTKDSKDYTPIVIQTYNILKNNWSMSIRISDIWTLLMDAFFIEEFELLDTKVIMNGPLQSYLIDEQIKWMNGEEVDFHDIADALLTSGDFTCSEKRLFADGNIEERLWAIMLMITGTIDLNLINNKNND